MFGKYEPEVHTGTRDERIRGLLREWWDVGGGLMRLHATTRERARIEAELLTLGVEVFEGEDKDQGWIFGRDIMVPHGPRCVVETRGLLGEVQVCHCEYPWRAWREAGFEDGIGHEVEVDVYESMSMKEAKRRGLLHMRFTCGGTQSIIMDSRGRQYIDVKVGTRKEWVGPPRTFADADR